MLRRNNDRRRRAGLRRGAPRLTRLLGEPLEPRMLLATLANSGTTADVIYNLPATTNAVFLEDDSTAGNGMLQLRSATGTFNTTAFANPSGSLTINRGNVADTITVNALPDFTAGLAIGSAGTAFSTVTFAGSFTLASGKNVTANAV